MRVFHVTHKRYLKSIRSEGLCPWKARGCHRVWFATNRDTVLWALDHVADHHGWKTEDMVVLALNVRRNLLRRGWKEGILWSEYQTYPPERVFAALDQYRNKWPHRRCPILTD